MTGFLDLRHDAQFLSPRQKEIRSRCSDINRPERAVPDGGHRAMPRLGAEAKRQIVGFGLNVTLVPAFSIPLTVLDSWPRHSFSQRGEIRARCVTPRSCCVGPPVSLLSVVYVCPLSCVSTTVNNPTRATGAPRSVQSTSASHQLELSSQVAGFGTVRNVPQGPSAVLVCGEPVSAPDAAWAEQYELAEVDQLVLHHRNTSSTRSVLN